MAAAAVGGGDSAVGQVGGATGRDQERGKGLLLLLGAESVVTLLVLLGRQGGGAAGSVANPRSEVVDLDIM